jgi:hypothetical protein
MESAVHFSAKERVLKMLAKCANPLCSAPFRYLESGGLFRLESDPLDSSDTRTPEYFWLCRSCSAKMTLRLDEADGVRIVQSQDATPREGEALAFVLLDRQRGMLLNRINFFAYPTRKRREGARGGQVCI